ncbi:MAG: hypothetical protein ACKOH8_06320, partial [Gemmatimonadota bacterium]
TRDGKYLLIDASAPTARHESREAVYAVPTASPRSMEMVASSPSNDQAGTVSPDGKWLAYVSDESESQKVYVRPFRQPGGRFLISTGSGEEPLWVGASSLLYVDPDVQALIRADLTLGASVEVVRRETVRDVRSYTMGSPGWWNYDVSRDGRDLLLVKPARAAGNANPIVVVNWAEEVKARRRPATVTP